MTRQTLRKTLILIGAVVVTALGVTGAVLLRGEREYKYPLDEQRPIDPALVQYRQVDEFETELDRPRDLAVGPEGHVYVAGERIAVFTADGTPLPDRAIDLPGRAMGITFDGDKLYVALTDRVQIRDAAGGLLAEWPALEGGLEFTAVAARDDHVYLTAWQNREGVLLRYGADGRPLGETRGFSVPSPYLDVVFAPDGRVRVGHSGRRRVEAYDDSGDLMYFWGESSPAVEGFCGCCNPVSLAVLPDGRIVTAEKGLPTVKVYADDRGDDRGRLEAVVAGPNDFAEHREASGREIPANPGQRGLAVAADAGGRILVLDPVTRRVRTFVSKETP